MAPAAADPLAELKELEALEAEAKQAEAKKAAAKKGPTVFAPGIVYSSSEGSITGVESIPLFVPWAEQADDKKAGRVVGWSAGTALNAIELRKLVRNNDEAKADFDRHREQLEKGNRKDAGPHNPNKGLPADWHAFWSTMPHLDAKTAYKEYKKQKVRAQRTTAQETAAAQNLEKFKASVPAKTVVQDTQPAKETVEQSEIDELERLVAAKQQELRNLDNSLDSWNRKIARIRKLDVDDETESKKVKKELAKANYSLGEVIGMGRSQDSYFDFVLRDSQLVHKRRFANLQKSNSLLKASIIEMKGECDQMLQEHKTMVRDGKVVLQSDDEDMLPEESCAEEVLPPPMVPASSLFPPTQMQEPPPTDVSAGVDRVPTPVSEDSPSGPVVDAPAGPVVAKVSRTPLTDALFGDFDSDEEL